LQQEDKTLRLKGSPIPWWSRIRVRVLIFGVLLSTIPVLFVSFYYLYFAKLDLQRSIQIQNNLLVERSVQEVGVLLSHTEESLKSSSLGLSKTEEVSQLYRILQEFTMIDEVVHLDAEGKIRQGVNRFKIFGLNQTEWVNPDILSTLALGKVYYSPVSFLESGVPIVKIVVPYFSSLEHHFQGGIGAQVRLRSLLGMVRPTQVNEKIDMFLVDKSGTLIAHSDLTRVLEKTDVRQSFTVQHFLQIGDPSQLPTPNEYISYSGLRVLGGYSRLQRTDWAVVIEQPVAVAFAPINALLVRLIVFLIFVLFIAIVLSILFALSFTKPIERLERTVRQVGGGELNNHINLKRKDELGQLTKSFNDMLEKLRLQAQSLLQEKERLDTIVNGIGAGLALVYPDLRVAWMNPVLENWVRDEDLQSFLNQGVKQKVFRHRIFQLEQVNSDEPSRLLVVEDITEQSRLEEMVMQADKLSALGLMASGFAHEINNPLATIQGYAEDMEERLHEQEDSVRFTEMASRYLRIIRKNIDRAQRITQNLLHFSRKPEWKQESVDVIKVLEESITFLNHALVKKGVVLVKAWEAPLPKVNGDALQLMQVFVNLINNSLDAIRDGGEIWIKSKVEQDRLILSFMDNGEGIAQEYLPKIFDPFFTTKEVGKGTGLGLFIIYGIMNRIGGSIRIESEEGQGTGVILVFPLHEKGRALE